MITVIIVRRRNLSNEIPLDGTKVEALAQAWIKFRRKMITAANLFLIAGVIRQITVTTLLQVLPSNILKIRLGLLSAGGQE